MAMAKDKNEYIQVWKAHIEQIQTETMWDASEAQHTTIRKHVAALKGLITEVANTTFAE